jgi:hypothetical protein
MSAAVASKKKPVLSLVLEPVEEPQHNKLPLKRRGRKRKIALDPKYYDPTFICVWPEICMGMKILIDRYDNVYTYDLERPVWIGIKQLDGTIVKTTEPATNY